jgi:uncharacterized phage infection (PIP) family protein YhgE
MQAATQELLQAIEQLPGSELDDLCVQVLQIRAKRHVPALSRSESDLMITINRALSSDLQHRFDHLVKKRQALTISEAELEELTDLTDQDERINAERITALSELAQSRNQSLRQVMQTLGITAPDCV